MMDELKDDFFRFFVQANYLYDEDLNGEVTPGKRKFVRAELEKYLNKLMNMYEKIEDNV